ETGGKLTLTGAGTLGGQGSEADVSGTLDLGTTTQTLDNFSLRAGGTVKNGTLSSSGVFNLQGGTVSAVLAGPGTVIVNGSVSFSRANSYTGGTTINAGRLLLLGSATLGSATGELVV